MRSNLIQYSVQIGPNIPIEVSKDFATKNSAVLADQRGWKKYGYMFEEKTFNGEAFNETNERDTLVIRLETSENASKLCGFSGFSCQRQRPNDIVIHLGNWMGGSRSRLPLERYRNYVINHEVGHFLGLEHQKCPIDECKKRGMFVCPGSVMQQMTRGPSAIAPCSENDWPLDPDWQIDDPRSGRSTFNLFNPVFNACIGFAAVVLFVIYLLYKKIYNRSPNGQSLDCKRQFSSRQLGRRSSTNIYRPD